MDKQASRPPASQVPGARLRHFVDRFHGGATGWIVLGISLLITGLGWYISNLFAERWATQRFEFQVEEARLSIVKRMLEYEQVLRGAVGLFESMARVVSREEWRQYIAKLEVDRHFPGLQGIGFAQWVEPGALDLHVHMLRSEGFRDYTIRPAGDREAYTSIIYLEPFAERNLRAFGFDMYSEPVRRAAMDRARDTGLPALSGRVTLVQETDRDVQPGFLMYLPVYRAGTAVTTQADRRAALLGFVYSPFRVGDLMKGILPHGTPEIDFEIYDGPVPSAESHLYSTAPGVSEPPAPRRQPDYRSVHTIEVAGHTWNVRFSSRENFEEKVASSQPTIIAVGGIAIDLLLFVIIMSLSSEHKRVLAKAAAMTREMRQGQERYRVLLNEVHHRVKNNLQVIASLLNLQLAHTDNVAARSALAESQSRVRSMALVHQLLYERQNFASVELGRYLQRLVQLLCQLHAPGRREVAVSVEGSELGIEVDPQRAIPCGLVVHELVTNALKHGFPQGASGSVRVTLNKSAAGEITVTVADDGVGLPVTMRPEGASSLGLQLVPLLAEQLGAKLRRCAGPGACFELRFAAISTTATAAPVVTSYFPHKPDVVTAGGPHEPAWARKTTTESKATTLTEDPA